LYLCVERVSDGLEIAEIQIAYGYARSGYGVTNYYQATGSSNTDWSYVSGYTTSAYSYTGTVSNSPFANVDFPTTGAYRVRYKTRMRSSSGYKNYKDGSDNTTVTQTFHTVSASASYGVAITNLDQYFTFQMPSNFIELSGGGFQAVTNSSQYVKIKRFAVGGSATNTTLEVKGGVTSLEQELGTQQALRISKGYSTFNGKMDLGISWNGNYASYGTSYPRFRSAPVLYHTYLGTGGSEQSPDFINCMTRASFILNPGSSTSNRYYALHHRQFNTQSDHPNAALLKQASTDVYDETDIQQGTIVLIFNANHGRTAYIEGISGRGDDNGHYGLGGGHAVWLMYNKNTLYNGTSVRNYEGGWILVGHDDGGINSW